MKRSVAMMACVLSGAMVLGSFSPVMAETGAKAVSATVTDSKSSDDKKDDAKADTADKKDDAKDTVLEDGTYSAEFDTDSSMFHVNEANDGKGTLTVKDGKMTIHVSLNSKKIVNLFVGKADDAQKDSRLCLPWKCISSHSPLIRSRFMDAALVRTMLSLP